MFKVLPKKVWIPIIIFLTFTIGIYLLEIPLVRSSSDGYPFNNLPSGQQPIYSSLPGAANIQQGIFYGLGESQFWTFLGTLNINYDLFLKQGDRILSDGDTICNGDKIDFIFNKDGEWFGAGGNYDSPPAYWLDKILKPTKSIADFLGYTHISKEVLETFNSLPSQGCEPQNLILDTVIGNTNIKKYAPLIIQIPSHSLTAGSNINCSGDSCIVDNKIGTSVSITANIDKTYFQSALAQGNQQGNECNYDYGFFVYHDPIYLSIEPVTKTWNLNISNCAPPVPPPPPAPIITIPSLIEPDWCTSSFQYILNWEVNTTQLAKQIQVSTSSNFNSLIYDSGKITSDIATYTLPVTGSGLEYNKTYYWRVRVWNTDDVASVGWSDTKTFTTPLHAYPDASFTKSPANPKIGQSIKFTDTSTPYGGATISKWSWTFQDGTPSSSILQNPSIAFNSSGKKDISLKVTDSDSYFCSASSKAGTGSGTKNYIWTEVAPR